MSFKEAIEKKFQLHLPFDFFINYFILLITFSKSILFSAICSSMSAARLCASMAVAKLSGIVLKFIGKCLCNTMYVIVRQGYNYGTKITL